MYNPMWIGMYIYKPMWNACLIPCGDLPCGFRIKCTIKIKWMIMKYLNGIILHGNSLHMLFFYY